MSHLFGEVSQKSVSRSTDTQWRAVRLTRDGSLISLPWYQALVFEGVVYGFQWGGVTTGINVHAGIDADQPEIAVAVPDGLTAVPLSIIGVVEGTTTLGRADVVAVASDVLATAGTSTATTGQNLRLNSTGTSTSIVYHTYAGNGADLLTAGHHWELERASSLVDTDATTSGFVSARVMWAASRAIAPVIAEGGSIAVYMEGQAAASNGFATVIWAELPESAFE